MLLHPLLLLLLASLVAVVHSCSGCCACIGGLQHPCHVQATQLRQACRPGFSASSTGHTAAAANASLTLARESR
jgi:hypothetical protein